MLEHRHQEKELQEWALEQGVDLLLQEVEY
jgi:hypothetical protein